MKYKTKTVEDIFQKFPMPREDLGIVEHSLEHISPEDAAVIWQMAKNYFDIAKEMNNILKV